MNKPNKNEIKKKTESLEKENKMFFSQYLILKLQANCFGLVEKYTMMRIGKKKNLKTGNVFLSDRHVQTKLRIFVTSF